MKTHPFYMTFDEIRRLTFPQIQALVDERNAVLMERRESMTNFMYQNKESLIPVADLTRQFYDG